MGVAKAQLLEDEERGWSEVDKFVCAACVEDDYLKDVILAATSSRMCSYCGTVSGEEIAAPFSAVMECVASTVTRYFCEPTAAGMPWDDGPLFESRDTADILAGLPLNCNDELFEDIARAFHNDGWTPAANGHWASSHYSDVLHDSWSSFVSIVQHNTRFFFNFAVSPSWAGTQEIPPQQMLSTLGELVRSLGLVRQLEPGTPLFRARERPAHADWTADASTMSAPPSDLASAGRMNPAGISYLYTSLDPATALSEVLSKPPMTFALATFQTTQSLAVLDLTSFPPYPSIFDSARYDELEGLAFLHRFAEEISRPVGKDRRDHVEYVPSQVVSEYFALVHRDTESKGLDGILYPSAVRQSGENLVLFPTVRGMNREFGSVTYKDSREFVFATWDDVKLHM
jgi:RES domain-containing protein